MHLYTVGDEPIPGYRLTRFLGVGGYGQVWAASSPGGIDIALKILSVSGTRGGKELRGVGLVKKLRHPNLVPLYAYWVKDEFNNIVDGGMLETQSLRGEATELIIAMGLGDKSVAQRLDEVKKEGLTGIPLEELLNYLTGAAKAIDFLNQPVHQLGSGQGVSIQHCDIKPGNMLIVGNEIQVCDYGLARAIAPDVRATAATGAGTQAYSAPELLKNQPSDHTDQYSLAISYYELRTGKLPFAENEALHAHIMGNLDFGLVTEGEQAALKRAAHLDPEQRFATAGEFIMALREATRVGLGSGSPFGSGSKSGSTPSGGERQSIDDRIRPGAEIVPHYKLVRLLGRGGYGEVWEGKGPGGVKCALKIVRNLEGTQGNQEYRSLTLIRELEHERLIRLQAVWLLTKDGSHIPDEELEQPNCRERHALVMATDLADKSLLQYWQEHQAQGRASIPVADLIRIIRQSADAIDYVNDRDILHRDIKPENILLTKDLKVKVSDFGLAKFLEEGTGAAIHQASVGLTLAYAAPELFDNRVSRWTDQYALALTYYRLRTGNFPFPNEFGPRQMMLAHTEGRLEFAGVRPEEERVLRKATSLEPQARFPNCISMVEALEQAHGLSSPMTGTTTTTRPTDFKIPAQPSVRVGQRTPDPRQTLLQSFPAGGAAHDARTEPFVGGAAALVTSDSEVLEELSKPASLKTTPGADLQATVIPDMLELQPRPSEKPRKPIPTPDLEQVFHASPAARRKRILAYGGGIVVAAGMIGFAAHQYFNRAGLAPASSSAPSSPPIALNNPPNNKSGTVTPDRPDKKERVEPQPDPLAIEQEKFGKDVDSKLKAGDFAGAATVIRGIRKPTNKIWADQQDERILSGWRKAAGDAGTPQKQIESFELILKAYPNDEISKKQKSSLETELANAAVYNRYRAVLKDISAANLDVTRAALVDLQKQAIPDLQQRIKDLLSKLSAYDIDKNLPADLKMLDSLAGKYEAFSKSSADEFKPLPALYRDLWDANVHKLVPALNVGVKPEELLKTFSKLRTPWSDAARAEVVTELLRLNKRVADADRALPSGEAPADLQAYRAYVSATRGWIEKSDDVSADAVAALAPANAAPYEVLSPLRRGRLTEILAAAADGKRQRSELAAPFSAPDAAYRWLGAAERLGSRTDSGMSAEQRARLQLDLALAALTKPQHDVSLGRRLTDALVAPSVLASLQLSVPDLVQLWVMHARSRETTAAGRIAAVASLANALKPVSDELNGVPIHYLAAEIINPLDQTDGQMILGQPIAPAVKAPGARLCADAARHLFRFRDDWARELGKNASPLDVALRLLDRAAQLDKKAEYLAWHGLILFEQPRFGPADVDRAAADAAGAIATNDKYCGGHVLDGMVRAWRGKVQSDARDRLKLCTEADEQFKKAELLAGADNRGELVALYQRAADNDIQLAALKPQKPDKAEYLARSKARAEKLLELEPARNAVRETLACALEDQAWLVKSDKRFGADGLYAQAIAEFTRALGGFGDRSKARLDRGRCRFKWAEDKFKSKEDGGRLDEPLLGDAKDDLTEAVNAAPDSNDAVEAHYWLAQVERLRYKAIVDLNSPRSGTQHAAAVAELEAGLKLARDLQNPFWAEPIAQEWASAALGEVNRLYAVNKTQLPRAVADATRAAEELKPYSAPWYALLRMLLLPAERKNDSAGYYQELVERSKGGLGPCRQQDRIIQFSIYITRADARVLFGTPDVGLDFKSALADAEAAERIAHELEMTNERAYARGLMGLARMRLVVTGASSRERIAYRKAATDDFRAALKLAPDHFAAWQWKVLQAVTLERKDPFEATDTAEIATYFADQYRIFREMKPPISPSPGHEKNLIAEVDRNCADLEKNQAVRLRDAIITDKEKKHPDRAKWQLGLAEMDAHSDDPKWLAEARTQFDVALSSLTPEAQKPHAAQIARIRDVLAKAEKK